MAVFELLIDRMTVGPVLPATILVGLLLVYTAVAMIGLVDLDLDLPELDVDLDVPDLDAPGLDAAADLDLLGGLGGAALRWVNLGRVPMIVWGGLFTVAFWSISYGLWHRYDHVKYDPAVWITMILTARNVVLSVFATKFFTSPLVKYFRPAPQYDTDRIVGSTCEVVSLEATPTYGQAKFRTHAAPLLLNIRVDGDRTFAKGDEVRVVRFDPDTRVYHVTGIDPP